MASYLEKYQVLDELKKIDKFKSEGTDEENRFSMWNRIWKILFKAIAESKEYELMVYWERKRYIETSFKESKCANVYGY